MTVAVVGGLEQIESKEICDSASTKAGCEFGWVSIEPEARLHRVRSPGAAPS